MLVLAAAWHLTATVLTITAVAYWTIAGLMVWQAVRDRRRGRRRGRVLAADLDAVLAEILGGAR